MKFNDPDTIRLSNLAVPLTDITTYMNVKLARESGPGYVIGVNTAKSLARHWLECYTNDPDPLLPSDQAPMSWLTDFVAGRPVYIPNLLSLLPRLTRRGGDTLFNTDEDFSRAIRALSDFLTSHQLRGRGAQAGVRLFKSKGARDRIEIVEPRNSSTPSPPPFYLTYDEMILSAKLAQASNTPIGSFAALSMAAILALQGSNRVEYYLCRDLARYRSVDVIDVIWELNTMQSHLDSDGLVTALVNWVEYHHAVETNR